MGELHNVIWSDANSRDNYFTVHNVRKAQRYGKGSGVKIGIIDWLFGLGSKDEMYSGFVDVTASIPDILQHAEHGYWMASVLKEIAPECEIFAINAVRYEEKANEAERLEYLERAVDWAIDHDIDILTYSHPRFQDEYLERRDKILEKAYEHGIMTTFIHCDHKENLWPFACFPFVNNGFDRLPDYNIYHFDYNVLLLNNYQKYALAIDKNDIVTMGNNLPFYSFSSMSPVLAGFLAILRSIKPHITKQECCELLDMTVYAVEYEAKYWFMINPCPKVVDIGSAAEKLAEQKNC